jgi:5-methylcytosine-specific restriction endonuclease McrA
MNHTCSVDGCAKRPTRVGMCNAHYMRLRRTGATRSARSCLIAGCEADLSGSQHLCAEHRGCCVEPNCGQVRAGRSSRCARHKNYGGAALPAEKGEKRCRTCLTAKPLDEFYETSGTRDGRQDRCKECFADYRAANRSRSAEWRKANAERIRNYNRAYEPRMRELVRARSEAIKASALPFTLEQLSQRMAFHGNRCWLCSGPFEQVDHVKPINAGGLHILANMRPCCAKCNRRKNKTWPLTTAAIARIRAA